MDSPADKAGPSPRRSFPWARLYSLLRSILLMVGQLCLRLVAALVSVSKSVRERRYGSAVAVLLLVLLPILYGLLFYWAYNHAFPQSLFTLISIAVVPLATTVVQILSPELAANIMHRIRPGTNIPKKQSFGIWFIFWAYTALGPVGSVAYFLIPPAQLNNSACIGRPIASSASFSVRDNHTASGKMGDIGDVTIARTETLDSFVYKTMGRGPHESGYKYVNGVPITQPVQFAGVFYLAPPDNFGQEPGIDLRELHPQVIKWEARSPSSDIWTEFVIGGATWVWDGKKKEKTTPKCPDTLPRKSLGIKKLSTQWQPFDADLSDMQKEDYANVINAFSWVISWGSIGVELNEEQSGPVQARTVELEIRNIRYERQK